MSDIKVPFFKPSFSEEEKKAVLEVIDSGWLTTGKVTHEFEKEFAQYISSPYALAVNSNTSGMILAMEACGVKKGRVVITTPYTFVSTAASAIHLNADVIFADTEKDSYSISPEAVEKILKKLRDENRIESVSAIVPVHIAGNLCDMDKLNQLASAYSTKNNRIYVIEDCAHSFPSKTRNGFAGTLGDAGIFSFYATKTMTTGEGGMITTGNKALAERMTKMRLHGMNRDAWDRYTSDKASWEYDIIAPGFKSNLPDILSAIGRVQLKKAAEFDRKRKEIVKLYNDAFKNEEWITLPPDGEGNAWHLYLLQIKNEKLGVSRKEFAKELQDNGIGISMHFIPVYNFSWWKEKYPENTPDRFPNAQHHFENTISLPLWPDMTQEMIHKVIDTVIQTGRKYSVR